MAYDYREAVKDDVLEYINNEINFEDFDTLEEFGGGADYLITHGAEAADVTIRCYLLGECIAAALEEIEDDFNEAHEGEEDEEE